MRPSSSGWRSDSTASRRNSVSSSRNSSAVVRERDLARAREDAAAAEQPGGGDGVVGRAERPLAQDAAAARGARPPTQICGGLERLVARELGRIVASRRASIVLPAPGRPDHQQVVAARRRDLEGAARLRLPADVGQVHAVPPGSGSAARRRRRRRLPRAAQVGRRPRRGSRRATTRRPADLRRLGRVARPGTTTPSNPAAAAAIATDSTPGVGEHLALQRELAERTPVALRRAAGTCAVAAATAIAIGRSRPGPSLRRFAGARFTTTRRSGHSSPACSTAGRIRSRPSCTVAPGRPVNDERREPATDERLDGDPVPADADAARSRRRVRTSRRTRTAARTVAERDAGHGTGPDRRR